MRIRKLFSINTLLLLLVVLLLLLTETLPVLGTNVRHNKEENGNQFKDSIPWRQIKFISPQQSLSQSRWQSGIPSFSGKGMDHLYLLTQYVVDLLQTPGLPFSVIKEDLFDDPIPVLEENKGKLLSHFWTSLMTATVFACIAVVVPLVGFVCCCCCHSDKHSRRAKHKHNYSSSSSSSPIRRTANKKKRYKVDGRCDPCIRTLSGVNLFIILLLMSFFVICAFVTNEYIRSGVQQLPKTLNQSTDDLMLYLNNTQYEVNTLLGTNFEQLEEELGNSLDKSGLIVKNRLAVLSEAASLENLTDIVMKLESILSDLRVLSGETTELRLLTVQLQAQLSRSKNDLESFLNECKDRVCIDLKLRYTRILDSFSVSTRIDLPDLSPLMQNISNLLKADIVREISKGKEAFDEISLKIQSTVNNSIPDIKRQIKAVGLELSAVASDINEALRRPFVDLYKVKSNVNIGDKYMNDYEIYRWYSCLIGASILFLILVCYTFGLLSGACSQQPTRHNYRRRSKSSSRFFRCGIVLLFLLFLPLLLSTIFMFLLGIISDKVFCYYLENPSEPQSQQIMSIIQNKFQQLSYAQSMDVIQGVKPNIADVLTRCHQNLSLYNVLQLNKYNQIQINEGRVIKKVNITEILAFKDRYRIEEKLNVFLNRVNVNPSNVVILTAEGSQLLENLKQTSLGTLNFSSYANVIKHSITPLDLVSISTELEQEASRLPKSDFENIAKLRNIAMDLKAPINLVVKIKNTIEALTVGAEKIEKKANYGNKGLKEALTSLLKQAEDAQKFIAVKGRTEIHTVAKAFVSDMSSLVDQYAEHVVEEIDSGIGKCDPVSRAVNASVMAFCKQIVLPFNGYWFSMGSALILVIPSTLFAYILSRLYHKIKRFPTRRESDSTLDNLDEDDIPLAHVDNKNNTSEGRVGPAPSAPLPIGHNSRSPDDDNWSPGALPPHLYGSRPPPYNFVN